VTEKESEKEFAPVTVTESEKESESAKESGKVFVMKSEMASATGSEMDAETEI
jgi:hypothetical protein